MIRIKTTNGRPHTSSLILVIAINILVILFCFVGVSAILNISILKVIGLLLLGGFSISGVESVVELTGDLFRNITGQTGQKTEEGETDQ